MHPSFNSSSDQEEEQKRCLSLHLESGIVIQLWQENKPLSRPSMSNRPQQLPVVSRLNRSSDLFVLSRHQLILLSSKQMKTINQWTLRPWNCGSTDYLSEDCFHLQRTPTFTACFQCCQFCKGRLIFVLVHTDAVQTTAERKSAVEETFRSRVLRCSEHQSKGHKTPLNICETKWIKLLFQMSHWMKYHQLNVEFRFSTSQLHFLMKKNPQESWMKKCNRFW